MLYTRSFVSIHAPARGATLRGRYPHSTICCFNPRTREGCDVLCSSSHAIAALFQSTHPRGVRHSTRVPAGTTTLFQSTHPRGVRLTAFDRAVSRCRVSIHAPARGATRSRCVERAEHLRFNPRTREGCDHKPLTTNHKPIIVSIHAPARGATMTVLLSDSKQNKFQSTHPRGVRQHYRFRFMVSESFNPRTREGCDTRSPVFGFALL